jgi:hypothetical protein
MHPTEGLKLWLRLRKAENPNSEMLKELMKGMISLNLDTPGEERG